VNVASLTFPAWRGGDRSDRIRTRERIRSVIGVVLIHVVIIYGLVAGLAYRFVLPPSDELAVFDVADVPPPPPVEPVAKASAPEREGAAAPANRRARPTPIVVPPPRIRIEVAQQVGAAPVAGQGADRSAGAAPLPGPGTGAGGSGSGLGSGGAGSGTGGGGIATRARLIRGRIDDDDYPRDAYRERAGGTVTARLAIGADGRVTDCTVTRSSGRAELDETTCRLIRQRFRYAPARDAAGKAVPSESGWRQTWWLEPRR
jgi:protein TonB